MTADRFADQAWLKAEIYFAEACAHHPSITPHAVVHQAYYAMFHAARAVLLKATGAAPKKHGSVVGQFGLLAKDRGVDWRRKGEDFRTVEAHRIRADHNETTIISAENASDALQKAEAFLDFCAREFGFSHRRPASYA